TTEADDHCLHIAFDDLPFGTRFHHEVYLDGRVVPIEWPLRFATQSHWNFRLPPPDFSVAIGSCAYVNDPPMDRKGRAYGGDPVIFEALAAARPDLMLWLGDNLYFRDPDWSSESGMRSRYRKARGLKQLQPFLGATSHYAIWDDHDFGANDSDRTNALKDAALRTFRLYWANAGDSAGGQPGVQNRFTWGDAEFFLLDDRYHRSPNAAPDDADKTMFGTTQIDWLLDSLSNSEATFKIIAGGNQFLNPMCYFEGLGSFARDRERILTGLSERKISGVLFLSGDRHQAELIKVEREGTYPLYDFTSSPLLAGLHAVTRELENPARVPGTLVFETRNFGRLSFSGPRGERIVRISCHGVDGQELWHHELAESALR
ncbi:MAG: alkaline phosphatase family protein, partial [Salinibacterium sp.]|nr:alkaline phosphatase family protein [Salinibacterium sp.]